MITPNNRATVGEGTGEPRGIRFDGDGIAGPRRINVPAAHIGSALTFQSTDAIGGELLVTLTGEIDASNSGWLSGRLTTAITSRPGVRGVVVDLTRVGFCDASGINVLVHALKQCRGHQIALELAGAHGKVARVLRLTGVDEAMPLHTDLNGALHAIARHRPPSIGATTDSASPGGRRTVVRKRRQGR